jgi:hypothetical protein
VTQIVWLASYPRSGNTWMRFLLYNLHHCAPFASHQVDKFIPSFHKGLTSQNFGESDRLIVKTHLRYHEEMPLAECTAGAIYVYRHPMAVMASNVRYVMRRFRYEEMTAEARCALVAMIVSEFVDNCGLLGWLDARYGRWDDNLHSWLGATDKFPVLAIRYENLARDPLAEIDRVCGFLGLKLSAAAQAAAVANASEQKLMEMEERELRHGWPGIFDNLIKGGSRNWRFVRDASLEPLAALVAPDLLDRAAATLGAAARQFGYD